jgi:hypothetical protein
MVPCIVGIGWHIMIGLEMQRSQNHHRKKVIIINNNNNDQKTKNDARARWLASSLLLYYACTMDVRCFCIDLA